MATKLGIALAVLSILIFFSLIESILSWGFSLLFQTPLEFPLVDWLLLVGNYFALLFLKGMRIISLTIILLLAFVTLSTSTFTYLASLTEALYDLMLQLLTFPLVIFYPLISMFFEETPLDPLIMLVGGIVLFLDTFLIGGSPALIAPPPGNVMYVVFNWFQIETIILKLGAALTYLGLDSKVGITSTILHYSGLSKSDRLAAWRVHYGKEAKEPPTAPKPPKPPDPTPRDPRID